MSEANQATNDAREASKSRVTTLDTLLGTSEPAQVAPEQSEKHEERPVKKPIQERITQLVDQRREAQAKADAAEARAKDLEAQLESLKSRADPIQVGDKPQRTQFMDDSSFIEALTDWKAKETIAEREKAQFDAQIKADSDAIQRRWEKRIETAKVEISDFEDVMSASDVEISPVVVDALKRHHEGHILAYLLAQHPEEARKVNRMHPIDAVMYLDRMATDLKAEEAEPAQKRSKAPEPITPVRAVVSTDASKPQDFATYRARRMADKK